MADPKTASSVPRLPSQVVDEWFFEAIPNSPVSQSVGAWNHLMAAKEVLKQRLDKEFA